MFVPLSNKPVAALIVPVAERLPVEPLSVRVNKVFGDPSASVMVRTPLLPAVAKATVGLLLVKASGEPLERVSKPLAVMSVAPAIAPVPVIPPELLLIPPEMLAPLATVSPALSVWRPVNVLAWFL